MSTEVEKKRIKKHHFWQYIHIAKGHFLKAFFHISHMSIFKAALITWIK